MDCSVGILLRYHCYSKMYKFVGPSEVISSKQRKTFENKIHSLLYDVYKMHEQFPGKLVTCICYENYVHRTKSD
jgi:hypothetical protein